MQICRGTKPAAMFFCFVFFFNCKQLPSPRNSTPLPSLLFFFSQTSAFSTSLHFSISDTFNVFGKEKKQRLVKMQPLKLQERRETRPSVCRLQREQAQKQTSKNTLLFKQFLHLLERYSSGWEGGGHLVLNCPRLTQIALFFCLCASLS